MTTAAEIQHLQQNGLYSTANEHDACGVGFVAHIKGKKSHDIVKNALKILENLDHRGAVGADKLMGDGAGILIQLPDALYREEMAAQGVTLPPPGEYGVGMIFLPKEHASRLACEQEMERAIKAEGQVLLGWRDVPVNRDMPMSPTVRAKEPIQRQVFIGRGQDVIVQDALERKLYVIRKTASAHIQALKLKHSKEYYGLSEGIAARGKEWIAYEDRGLSAAAARSSAPALPGDGLSTPLSADPNAVRRISSPAQMPPRADDVAEAAAGTDAGRGLVAVSGAAARGADAAF